MNRFLIAFLVLFVSCKKETKTPELEKELTIAEKIANAHGFESWKDVSQIEFTFNVDRDSSHFERSWIWQPKSDKVTMITATDTVTYNRKSIDSLSIQADQGFINDKFWLLIPFQLVWDDTATISEPSDAVLPIKNTKGHKITITYPQEGGYTPGDAYDIYYDSDFIIREWGFRKGNADEPSLSNTFEDTENHNGIIIAKNHKKKNENWNLNFTNIKVVLD